ncbi:MAG: hypothetical protein ABDH21_05635 [bacterium]
MNSFKKGFSILELAFSVAILALVIIFVIGMYSMFFTSSTKINEENIANFIALSYLNLYSMYASSEQELLKQRARALVNNQNQNFTTRVATQFGKIYKQQYIGRRNYTIMISATELSRSDVASMCIIRVEVSWFENRSRQGQLIRGYGRSSISLERIINIPE